MTKQSAMSIPTKIPEGKYKDRIHKILKECKRNRNKKLDGKMIRSLDTGYSLTYCPKNVTESHIMFLKSNSSLISRCILILPSKMYMVTYECDVKGVDDGSTVFHGYFSQKSKTFYVDNCNMNQGVNFNDVSPHISMLLYHCFKLKYTNSYKDASIACNHIMIKPVATLNKSDVSEYLLFKTNFEKDMYVVFAQASNGYEPSLWWTLDNKLAYTAASIILGKRYRWT